MGSGYFLNAVLRMFQYSYCVFIEERGCAGDPLDTENLGSDGHEGRGAAGGGGGGWVLA